MSQLLESISLNPADGQLLPDVAARSPTAKLAQGDVRIPPVVIAARPDDRAMNSTQTFCIRPIPSVELAAVRSSGVDASGSPVVTVTDGVGSPLRCCLRNIREDDDVILFGYEPPIPGGASPYRELGAVFAHAQDCEAPEAWDTYPDDWQGRPQVLRAYDERGWIHPASTSHDGSDPGGALTEVLALPGVVEVHSRNIVYGCFMFAATAV
jgi:Protein of unknown function (DUF1203)